MRRKSSRESVDIVVFFFCVDIHLFSLPCYGDFVLWIFFVAFVWKCVCVCVAFICMCCYVLLCVCVCVCEREMLGYGYQQPG
jgi:hypothetical protein